MENPFISYRLGMVRLQRYADGDALFPFPTVTAWAWLGCNPVQPTPASVSTERYRLGMVRLQPYSKSQAAPSVRLTSLQSTSNNANYFGG